MSREYIESVILTSINTVYIAIATRGELNPEEKEVANALVDTCRECPHIMMSCVMKIYDAYAKCRFRESEE